MPVTPNPSDPTPGVSTTADLLTVEEYQDFMGLDTIEPEEETQITALITMASRTIRSYTDRKFDSTGVASDRTFRYEGGDALDTDDYTGLVSVNVDTGIGGYTYPLTATEYRAMPYRETTDDFPHHYVLLHSLPRGYSPAMGFTRNLDRYEFQERYPLITVRAVWGWPAVPEDVKFAAALIVKAVSDNPGPYMSESIEGFSRSQRFQVGDVIPDRAKTLLSPYVKINV